LRFRVRREHPLVDKKEQNSQLGKLSQDIKHNMDSLKKEKT